jgi:hypothetical protein
MTVKIELELRDDVYTGLVMAAQASSVANEQRWGDDTWRARCEGAARDAG